MKFCNLKCYIALTTLLILNSCTASIEQRMNKELGDLRSLQADQTIRISEMDLEIRQLTGRLDEVQHSSQGKTQAIEKSLEQLGNRLPPPSGVPEDLFSNDEQKISRIEGPASDLFRRGLQTLRTGDFKGAQSTFNSFVSQNPGTAFTDNALFWSGLSSVKLGEYDQAIVSFSEVYQKYPAEDMVAPALYFMGESLFALGSGSDGVLTFQKLIDEHPDSEYASKAKARIKISNGNKK